jgi:hypothetical protein
MTMKAGWRLRGVMTGFAVMATLQAGPAAPAETVSGIPFVPPPAVWQRLVDPQGGVAYQFRDPPQGGCWVVINAPDPVPEGGFRAWFDQNSEWVWEKKIAPNFEGSDEILTTVFEGIAKDGSEILSTGGIFDTRLSQIELQILAAKKMEQQLCSLQSARHQ